MKILFIANSFWNIKNFRGGLVSDLLNAGNEVYIAAPKDDHLNSLTSLGATCIELPLNRKGLSVLNEIFLYIRIRIIFFKINPMPKENPDNPGLQLAALNAATNISGLGFMCPTSDALISFIAQFI